ncbi:hypothetical protein D3273_23430 [Lichenibacterium minor]|uniref:Aerotolerance regulator N-terminal domain-containing protein n=1 Tax=Lichenibacterium minor TaxID=2316528 RepID=A0A4Q2U3M2_9HYPH|nr:hypothetical protein [Lichenibacterium minor]RYC29541.1 hypothetical protein D3273_23430 [Lichenibacterium minor]
MLENVCAWMAVLLGLAAAVLWLRASRIRVPPFPGVGLDSSPEVFEPVRQALAKGADLNARAAAVTAAAVVLQALSLGLHQVGR